MHPSEHTDPNRELDALMQDKVEAHCRQQLSAMLDGVLAPDEARFLLRRLQHDGELAGNWERWQVYGDLMRGGVSQLLPADFSQRVVAALEAEAQQVQPAVAVHGSRLGWTRWAGGAALAASVAMAALLVVQRDPQGPAPAAGSGPLEVATSGAPVSSTLPGTAVASTTPAPAVPAPATPVEAAATAAAGAIVLAAREAPRRVARRQTGNGAATTNSVARTAAAPPAPEAVQVIAASGAAGAVRSPHDPFVPEVPANTRPWPRAVVSGVGQGGFTVGFGAAADTPAQAAGFEHFQPRLPATDEPNTQRSAQAEAGADR